MFKFFKKIFIFTFLLSIFFVLGNSVLAQVDTGLSSVSGIGLGDTDPRIVVANVIRIFLGFLGIIALFLILYAGFLWTTSAGDASKLDKAKKILVSAVIGLLIILSSFAIASFVLSRLSGAITNGTTGPTASCDLTGTLADGCQSTFAACGINGTCNASCVCVSNGGGGGGGGGAVTSCDGDTFTSAFCEAGDPNDNLCASNEFCDTSCVCQPLGGLGDACDASSTAPICTTPDDTLCLPDLACDGTTCLCYGGPVIDWISPVNDLTEPNGAIGDFITIGGRFFGTAGTVYFSDGTGSTSIPASLPSSVNGNCPNTWTDKQIVVVVPTGASDGPVRVVRSVDSMGDSTDDARGNQITNFHINPTNRPGICGVTPGTGFFETPFHLEGVRFMGAPQGVYFGNETASTSALSSSFPNDLQANAQVPNIGAGDRSVFVSVQGFSSNAVSFAVKVDNSKRPIIDYIDPPSGPLGQYVTIFGSNFGNSYLAPAQVSFSSSALGVYELTSGLLFPPECQGSWWRNTHIIVPVPTNIVGTGGFDVVVTNNSGATSTPEIFNITTGSPGPGICAMNPHNGPVGTDVQIYGDRFGTVSGSAHFYNNISSVIDSWANQHVDTSVPPGAQTGTSSVITSALEESNYFPFSVGDCTADTDCNTNEECCGAGTYWDGICRATNTCNDFVGIAATTGYGWTFTSLNATSTVATSTATCSGWSGGNACLVDNGSCPNSPGTCQTNLAPATGLCGDSYCQTLPGCSLAGDCDYDTATTSPTYNRCIAQSTGPSSLQDTCDTPSNTVQPGYDSVCVQVTTANGPVNAWQFQELGNCPVGSYRDINGWCTVGALTGGPSPTCDLCDSGFSCLSGQCIVGGNVCDSDSTCNETTGYCEGSADCECCCEVAANDCCLGLTCQPGGCGDLSNPAVQANYGQCTGCRVENAAGVVDQAASDFACNCEGTSGKVCQIDVTSPTDPGVCVDAVGTTTTEIIPQATSTIPGALCIDEVNIGASTIATCNTSACGANYGCFDNPFISDSVEDCGICCCDPTIPNTILTASGKTLTCEPDKSPCDGANRGLYCGCESDTQCGSPNLVSCGNDTCCYPRPGVIATNPPDEPSLGSSDVCRNALIEATFDSEMDTSTFKGNIILLGDYGTDPCPSGTQYLASNGEIRNEPEQKNILVKTFNTIKNKINTLLFGEASAYTPIVGNPNFCAIQGRTDGYNNTAGSGILTFSPNRPLDGGIRHYAIILGDSDLTDDNPEGVLTRFAVGMGTGGTTPSEFFNSRNYKNAYIWSFVTLSDQSENEGYCTIDYIDISPPSYLVQTTDNSLVENDTNPTDDTFDSVKDSDKLFIATPKTFAGQSLSPVAGIYDWTWSWNIQNSAVADVIPVGALSNDKRLIRAKTTATEGKALAQATTNVTGTLAQQAEVYTGEAPVYLFLCNNPWPPVDGAGLWSPWQDGTTNCNANSASPGTCHNTNYEFYYCRDQGSESTYDDLPPISNTAVVRGEDSAQDMLKEYYFFREETPSLNTTNFTATVPPTGSAITLAWNNFPESPTELLREFIVHYGLSSGNYTYATSVPRQLGPPQGSLLSDSITIPDLINGQTYYFSVTAVYESGAESKLSEEISAIPLDTTIPFGPTGITAAIGDSQAEIGWNPVGDATSYKVYWKAGSGCSGYSPPDCYANSQNIGNATGAIINNLTNGTTYYFAVTAIDSSGNESLYSSEVVVMPAITSATVVSGATQVALGWISSLAVSSDDIYYIDMGTIAGIFEEFNEKGNRINLFGNIIKYIIGKISYAFTNSAEAQVGETRIPLCSASPGSICREDITESNGRHNTIIKNLTNGEKYRFIIRNGPEGDQKTVDSIEVEMKEESEVTGSLTNYGLECIDDSNCGEALSCKPSGRYGEQEKYCCKSDQCASSIPGGTSDSHCVGIGGEDRVDDPGTETYFKICGISGWYSEQ